MSSLCLPNNLCLVGSWHHGTAGDLVLLESTDPFAEPLAENTGVARVAWVATFLTSSHWQLYQGVGVLCVATANLFLLDAGIWSFKVQMPTDVVNQQAALSRCGCGFAMLRSINEHVSSHFEFARVLK